MQSGYEFIKLRYRSNDLISLTTFMFSFDFLLHSIFTVFNNLEFGKKIYKTINFDERKSSKLSY